MTNRIIIRHANEKSAASSDALRPVIGRWAFTYTKQEEPSSPDHWLWRTRKRKRLTASGVCFSKEVKGDDS